MSVLWGLVIKWTQKLWDDVWAFGKLCLNLFITFLCFYPPPLSLSVSLSPHLLLPLLHTRIRAWTHTHSLSLFLSPCPSLSPSISPSISLSLPLSLTLSLSPSLLLSLRPPPPLSLPPLSLSFVSLLFRIVGSCLWCCVFHQESILRFVTFQTISCLCDFAKPRLLVHHVHAVNEHTDCSSSVKPIMVPHPTTHPPPPRSSCLMRPPLNAQ